MKFIFILTGSIALLLGIVGIFIPGLPTTPFLLISAWAFSRGSEQLHRWLIHHKVLGKYINEYLNNKGLTKTTKIISISLMAVMISLSVLFFITVLYMKVIVIAAGIIGVIVILKLPTIKV